MPTYETHCGGCDTPLTGRQRQWCSDACRLRQYGKPLPLRDCCLCGQPFPPVNARQRVCRYGVDNERGDACFDVQEAAEEHQDDRVNYWREIRDSAVCEGPTCTAEIPYAGTGRPKRFCSARCRVAANRAAKKEAAK
ncbi:MULTISPECIES: hypothetical protein [unclassified Streptomyces]|uniref:hypothetical protein n=1 Tax=unclassified Streptomyces TaxID=2593676 RepID=UPI001319BBB6|nr:hypothetical protein [Streptomyces sp. AA1529]